MAAQGKALVKLPAWVVPALTMTSTEVTSLPHGARPSSPKVQASSRKATSGRSESAMGSGEGRLRLERARNRAALASAPTRPRATTSST